MITVIIYTLSGAPESFGWRGLSWLAAVEPWSSESEEEIQAGMLDGAPEDSRWAGLLLRAPRLGLLAGFGPSPRVQTEMKGPAANPSACQVRPPWRRSPRCSDSSGASGEPALDPRTSKPGGGLQTPAKKVARAPIWERVGPERRRRVLVLRQRITKQRKRQAPPTTSQTSLPSNTSAPDAGGMFQGGQ